MMPRVVAPEMLDSLCALDPDAIRARTDLARVHRCMGTRAIVLRGLMEMTAAHPKTRPLRILEIGAGDGSLMLGVAQALAPRWSGVALTLLDRQALMPPGTMARYGEVGWNAVQQVGDILDWSTDSTPLPWESDTTPWDLIVANLFLHHFDNAQLTAMLQTIARKSLRFFACEPRRNRWTLAASHLIGAIGVNHVTRQDSVLSVHAGFTGKELTALWPRQGGSWQMQEYSAGLFSHCFRFQRSEVP